MTNKSPQVECYWTKSCIYFGLLLSFYIAIIHLIRLTVANWAGKISENFKNLHPVFIILIRKEQQQIKPMLRHVLYQIS